MFRQLKRLGAASALALALVANSWAAQTWTVNFKDSDIQEVIKFVADVTGRTVVIDPRVKGRVKVISSKPLNEEELIQLFRTVLEMHDYSVVDVGDVLRIIPLKDARSSPVPVADSNTNEKGFLTQVIQLQNIAAAKVLPSIRPLVPQHSHLSAYDPSNAIIITDSAENIARIRDLIERLDQSATPITEIVELKYANASDMVQVLDSLEQGERKSNSPQNSLTLTADKRNNAILITGEDMQRERVKSLMMRLDKPRAQSGNVRVIYLEYADATEVAETLSRVMQNLGKLIPGGGKGEGATSTAATVEADEATNALLITASGDELQTLMDVVTRLDIRRAQILVEAIIAEVSDDDTKNLGVEWMFTNSERGVFGGSQGENVRAGVEAGAAVEENDGSPNDIIGALGATLAATAGQVLGVVGSNDDESFVALIKALQTSSETNILSTPSLLTMDNHEANFTVGQNIPILTGSQSTTNGSFSPFQTIQRQDVGIKLTVKPQVNEGNNVLLEIAQEVSSVNSNSDSGFITNQRKIETQVLAGDGEIVVLGGLIEDKAGKGETTVPILGKIPLIGRLFRSDSKSGQRTNLMVFIKATVIRDNATMHGATAEKYEYIRNQQLRQQDNGFLRLKDKDLSVLPTLEHHNLQLPPPPAIDDDVIVTPAARTAEEEEGSLD